MKIKTNTQYFVEEPFLNLQYNIESTNKVSEALKYSMWSLTSVLALSYSYGHGCVKVSISTNFNFKLVGDNIPQQTRKILTLSEHFNTNYVDFEKKYETTQYSA